MIDKIKSSLETSYLLFCFEFSDPSQIDKAAIEKALQFSIKELFDSQKKCDKAKSTLGKQEFNKALSAYFSSFQTSSGLDHKSLSKEITKNKKVILRHLGKENVRFLQLLISILDAEPEVKNKGLLFRREA